MFEKVGRQEGFGWEIEEEDGVEKSDDIDNGDDAMNELRVCIAQGSCVYISIVGCVQVFS